MNKSARYFLPSFDKVNWPLHSGQEDQNLLDLGFSTKYGRLFIINKSPCYFLSSFESIGLSVQEEFKLDFQDRRHGGHLEFRIETVSAFFLSTSYSDTSYQVSCQTAVQFKIRSSKQVCKMTAMADILDFGSRF